MKVFENKLITKEKFVKHLKWHQEIDAFESGHYGKSYDLGKNENFKACSVGCSLNSVAIELGENLDTSDHSLFEEYLGIPKWVAELQDTLFEGVSRERQKTLPLEFGEALNTGSDLSKIKVPFSIYILEQNIKTLDNLDCKEMKLVIAGSRAACVQMIAAQKSGDRRKIYLARSAAESAWLAADLVWSTRSAESAAWSAVDLVWSARSAAESAARSGARSEVYKKFADKLIELIKQCK